MISQLLRVLGYILFILPCKILRYLAWRYKIGWKVTKLAPTGSYSYEEIWSNSIHTRIVTKGTKK